MAPSLERLRRPVALAALPATVAVGAAFWADGPAEANNDSYCGTGVGHVAYHQWQSYRWRNHFLGHGTPYNGDTRYHHYLKKRQPSYYPYEGLGWLWFDGGELWKKCHATAHK